MRIRLRFVPIIVCFSFVSAAHSPLSAQRVDPSGQTRMPLGTNAASRGMQDMVRPMNAARGIAGGVLAGGLGFGIGLIGGANVSSGPGCPGEDCGLIGAIVGATVGESIGLALGSHYAGGSNRSLLATTLTTTAIGMAGVVAAFAAEGAAPYIIGVTPIIQVAAILAMEH